MNKLRVRTVILSDVHLGTSESKAAEVNHFLRHVRCEKLILNGDIIDGWQLQRGGSWTKAHTRFIRIVLKKLEKKDTQVVYLRGNHDDILTQFLPLDFENLTIVEEHIHEGPRGRYLVLHGDVFDTSMKQSKWIVKLGGFGYDLLIRINSVVNWCSERMGRGRVSLSKKVKDSVKGVISYINNFEETIADIAITKGYRYVICGHIHQPKIQEMSTKEGSVHYLNSGDWVENGTALEYVNGEWTLYIHEQKKTKRERNSNEKSHLNYEHLYNDVIMDNAYSLNCVEL
jgi:UDP-2,3-diacylglucosamine pyrophosphatase LpxH